MILKFVVKMNEQLKILYCFTVQMLCSISSVIYLLTVIETVSKIFISFNCKYNRNYVIDMKVKITFK